MIRIQVRKDRLGIKLYATDVENGITKGVIFKKSFVEDIAITGGLKSFAILQKCAAQELMDSLWECGLRPSQESFIVYTRCNRSETCDKR